MGIESTAITSLITSLGSALGFGWVLRTLVVRTLESYDKKHEAAEADAKKIKEGVIRISTDIAVIKNDVRKALALYKKVDEDHDRIIKIESVLDQTMKN